MKKLFTLIACSFFLNACASSSLPPISVNLPTTLPPITIDLPTSKPTSPVVPATPVMYVLTVVVTTAGVPLSGATVTWDGLQPGSGVTDSTGTFVLPARPQQGFNVNISESTANGFYTGWAGVSLDSTQSVGIPVSFTAVVVPVPPVAPVPPSAPSTPSILFDHPWTGNVESKLHSLLASGLAGTDGENGQAVVDQLNAMGGIYAGAEFQPHHDGPSGFPTYGFGWFYVSYVTNQGPSFYQIVEFGTAPAGN